MLEKATIKFLKDLGNNNLKEWFEANRATYETARADYSSLIQKVIAAAGKTDDEIAGLQAKECLFRINRDVRFSKNKAPYKNNFGASIVRGGKKSPLAGYYLHVQPDNKSFVGGGLWSPEPDHLKKVRQEIDYNLADFKKIVESKPFTSVYGDMYKGEDATLVRPPKGYDEENEGIEFIKLKSFIAMQPLKDEELTDKNLLAKITTAFNALHPLLQFINTAIEG